MRVAIYIRVSTKLQEEKYSINSQYEELTKYAKSVNWTIVDYYEDVDSGSKLDKRGLERMLDHVEDNLIDVVLCAEQDRLSRLDTIKWEYLKDILRSNKVKIAEPGRVTDLDNEDDEFISDIKNLIAQRQRKTIVKQMSRGLRQATREGKVWGKQPIGYILDAKTKKPVIDESTAWLVKYIDEAILTRGLTTPKIAVELNKICKTPAGTKWDTSKVASILKRPAYHGDFVRSFKNGETIITENIYPPLRTKEDFEEIQSILKSRYRRKPATPHILRDVEFTCSSCGKSLALKKGATVHKKSTYTFYSVMHSVPNDDCKYIIGSERITHNLIGSIKDILSDENSVNKYLQSDFDVNDLIRLENEIKEFEKENKKNNEKIDRLLDLYIDGTFPKAELDSKRSEITKLIEATDKKIKSRQRKRQLIKKNEINKKTVIEYLSIADRFDTLLDVEDQQKLIGSLFPNATIDMKNNTAIFHANLPQGIIMDINIKIMSVDELEESRSLERAKERHKAAQKFLNKNKGLNPNQVAVQLGMDTRTLIKDQELFGKLKFIGLTNKEEHDLKKKRILDLYENDRSISIREIERRTKIDRRFISKIINGEKSL